MHIRKSSAAGALVACAALLVSSTTLIAQQAQQRPAPLYFSRVELVRLHVSVRDGDEFVPGLTAADFRLYVDDEERIPEWVEEIDLTDDSTSAVEAQLYARRRFVIFLDAIFQHPAKLIVTKKAASEFLQRMIRPTDLVALAVAGYDGISLLEPFTGDFAKVQRRLDAVGPEWTWQVRNAMGRDRTFFADPYDHPLPRRKPAGVPRGLELLPDLVPDYNHSVMDLVGLYLSGLRELGVGLQALEGRKHLLFYSPGFSSWMVGLSSIRSISARAPMTDLVMDLDYAAQDLRDLMFMAAESLRDSDTAVHAMSTSRLSMWGGRFGMHSLWYFSDETNGSMAFHTHHLENATAKVNERTSRYYTLAYRRRPGDGERVSIEVSVERSGVKVEAPTRLILPPTIAKMTPLQLRLKRSEEAAVAAEATSGPGR